MRRTKHWCSYYHTVQTKNIYQTNSQKKTLGTGVMCAPSAEAVISGRVTYVKMSCLQATKIHLAPLPFRKPNWTRDRRRPPQTGILTWWYRMVNPYPGGCNSPTRWAQGKKTIDRQDRSSNWRVQDELIKPLLNQLNHDTWSQVWACQLTGHYHKRVPHMVLLYFTYILPVPRTGWWRN